MALKLDPVRLLIADDVGIGKTIEAALIARELLDRGEIERLAVLCPPHLVDQWVQRADGEVPHPGGRRHRVDRQRASSARCLQPTASFERIRTPSSASTTSRATPPRRVPPRLPRVRDRRRGAHLRRGRRPDAISATSCWKDLGGRRTGTSSCSPRRPTAASRTPSTACSASSIAEFVKPRRGDGRSARGSADRLSAHFVQRRRLDIDEWKEGSLFPTREEAEEAYVLTGEHQSFFELALDYCTDVVEKAGVDERRQRLNFWGTLALMRCVASSPAAALQALNTRRQRRRDRHRSPLRRQRGGPRLRRHRADRRPRTAISPR